MYWIHGGVKRSSYIYLGKFWKLKILYWSNQFLQFNLEMADRKINRVATSEIGVEANIEVKKIKQRKTKRKRPWIDFKRLWNEFRKSKSTYQPRV